MANYEPVKLFLSGWVLVWAGLSYAEPVDPRRPDLVPERIENDVTLRHWLPARIQQLEEEQKLLLKEISRLPQHAPRPLSDHMGYHSLPLDEAEHDGESISQIDVQFRFDPELGAIALVPAFVPGKTGSYAFPKRFKIEVVDRGAGWVGGPEGKWVVSSPPYEWVEVVNWMDEDFPDPGPYPVFFFIGDIGVYQLRMTMLPEGAGASFHALGEIYLFRDPENTDRLGDNMMGWDTVLLGTTNSLSKIPLWDVSYLNDGVSGLGMPLSEEVSEVEDFMVSWDGEDFCGDPVQVVLDLGQVQRIGRVQLWPAQAPNGMAIPQFGFPGMVSVEISNHPDFNEAQRFEASSVRGRLHNDNLLNVITRGEKARYIRLTLDDLGTYKGKKILGLGEIRVSEYDEVWSLNCAVSASGIPQAGMEQLPRLVDGFSRKRRILREVEWIKGLALRRPLDRRLAVVEQKLELARDAWSGLKFRASIWGGGLIGVGLLGAMGLQRLQRRKVLKKLKNRITRDLHDEVGSSLGGITLAARRMEDAGATPSDLSELSLMAREASASLKDVVWVIDQVTIRLPELLKKLTERAERVLSGIELIVDLPASCPNREVPLPFKRHLLMFFKEAVHNCARHSGATEVQLRISVNNEILTLSLEDNGCGFDRKENREGWGVDSMGKRAAELGGKMDLQTEPGKGTTVALTVPLSALLIRTDHTYQTSN
ncbi:sensor histidine kinase [Pontiella sulfatireligans]|uniref:Sensor histidine kinase LiaS n=1 Tax=Pontiella sulfatireligans TaxID=2750658 RepID=A0A6C2UW50_9BACT|nr:ATP-binding protein [Pontiella sulfatireligans]VGO23066.1 Sensor histidine kinase LiaS [Pontiella sulfatireligans]